tara:strand:+ start:7121 stop:7465 length:345 start_codon:yes stop_codon:yes gene_type:complete
MLDKEIIQGRKDRAALAALQALHYVERYMPCSMPEDAPKPPVFPKKQKDILSSALDSGLFRCFHGALPSSEDVYKQDRQTLIDNFTKSFNALSKTDSQELATKAVDACIELLRD